MTYQSHFPEFAVLLSVAGFRQRAVGNDGVRVSTTDRASHSASGKRTSILLQVQLQIGNRVE